MDISNIWAWIQNNWLAIGAAVIAFDAFLWAVAKLTPTKVDDNIAALIENIIIKNFFRK